MPHRQEDPREKKINSMPNCKHQQMKSNVKITLSCVETGMDMLERIEDIVKILLEL